MRTRSERAVLKEGGSGLTSPRAMLLSSSGSEDAEKGRERVASSYSRHPSDHTSDFVLYLEGERNKEKEINR